MYQSGSTPFLRNGAAPSAAECSRARSLREGVWRKPGGWDRRQRRGAGQTREWQCEPRSARVAVPSGSSWGAVLVVPRCPCTGRKMLVLVPPHSGPGRPRSRPSNFTRASCTSFPDVVAALSTPLAPVSHSMPFRGQGTGTKSTVLTLCSGGQTSFSWIQHSDVKPEGRGRL